MNHGLLRIEQLSLQYCTQLKSNILSHTYKSVFQPRSSIVYMEINLVLFLLGLCVQTGIAAINIIISNIAVTACMVVHAVVNDKYKNKTGFSFFTVK